MNETQSSFLYYHLLIPVLCISINQLLPAPVDVCPDTQIGCIISGSNSFMNKAPNLNSSGERQKSLLSLQGLNCL